MLVEKPIPGFYNGVSQQPPTLRLDTQLEAQENAFSSMVEGLLKRAPSEVVSELGGTLSPDYFYHSIKRDKNERYIVALTGNIEHPVRVWNLRGEECEVKGLKNQGYMQSENPKEDFRAYTVADHTFIVNRSKTTSMEKDALTPGTNHTKKYQKFTDLPDKPDFDADTVVEIQGDENDNFDSYYVKYEDEVYKECAKAGLPKDFTPHGMPLLLKRTGVLEFTLDHAEWAPRSVGDEESAPEPSFVGTQIRDVCFWKNRLVFILKDGVVLSKAGEYFDFWPTTVLEVLDDDPVDIGQSGGSTVANFQKAIPFNANLLIFSDSEQFILSSNDQPLSPRTASLTSTTTFDIMPDTIPARVGSNVYFGSPKGKYSTVREYFVQPDTLTDDAADVTAHCPNYIPMGFQRMVGCASLDTLFLHTTSEPKSVYVYKFYWSGNTKAQSSWSKWKFRDEVLFMAVYETTLYLLMKDVRDGTPYLAHMLLDNVPTKNLPFRVHLDRLQELPVDVDTEQGTAKVVLGYQVDSTDEIQIVSPDKGALLPGWVLAEDGRTLTQSHTRLKPNQNVLVGLRYNMRAVLSKWYVKVNDKLAGVTDRVRYRRVTLSFAHTGAFTVKATSTGRVPHVSQFKAAQLGTSRINEVPLASEERNFMTTGNAKNTEIEINNDSYLPCSFQTGSLQGELVRSARIVR